MNARSTRSPSAASAATGSVCFGTGRLSPVSADSSISSVAAVSTRPSAGTRSPASMLTMSPGTRSSIASSVEGSVPPDLRLDDHHLLEGGDARRRLALLVEPHRRVQEGQGDQDDAGGDLVRDEEAQDAGGQQDDLHRVLVLADERLPARLLGGLRELVRPELRPARLGLGGRQASLDGDVLALQGGVRRERVPARLGGAGCDVRHSGLRGARWGEVVSSDGIDVNGIIGAGWRPTAPRSTGSPAGQDWQDELDPGAVAGRGRSPARP